ncbi:protein SpAN-like [Argopecten irradians]|uniref:protein SpAN-like n=1 Tax=Argopecten irradians TaxID=31199 RepID=UPI003722E0A4
MLGGLIVVVLVTGAIGGHERRFVPISERWPRGEVPYRFSNTINETSVWASTIRSAIAEIEEIVNGHVASDELPCLRFWKSPDTESVPTYLYFHLGDDGVCGTSSGKTTARRHWVFLDDDCSHKSGVMSMILLTLGLNYEHSRPDRDRYVTVHHDNIQADYLPMYQKLNASQTDDFGLPYDFDSLTHFSPYQHAKYTRHPTMTSNWTTASFGNKDRLSVTDVRKLQIAYQCTNDTTALITKYHDSVSCSFQGTCELTNDVRYDHYHNMYNHRWQSRVGAMPHNGPTGDNSNGRGSYQYASGDDAWLKTDRYLPAGTYCIHLHYCIASTSNSSSSRIRVGNQRGNVFAEGIYVSKAWTPLNVTHVETSNWQLWIGSYIPSNIDPVAVDDVYVTTNACTSL